MEYRRVRLQFQKYTLQNYFQALKAKGRYSMYRFYASITYWKTQTGAIKGSRTGNKNKRKVELIA